MIDQMINLIILTVSSLMISGGDCKLDLSLDIGGILKTGNFEVDCTIIDKAKKLSRNLKMSSQSLDARIPSYRPVQEDANVRSLWLPNDIAHQSFHTHSTLGPQHMSQKSDQ